MQEMNLRGIKSPRIMLEERRVKVQKRKQRQHRMILIGLLVIGMIVLLYATSILLGKEIKSDAMELSPEQVEEIQAKQKSLESAVVSKDAETEQVSTPTETINATVETKTVETEVIEQPVVEEVAPVQESIYNANIPMPKEHQEYLYELCLERGLDYHKALALIHHESVFNSNEINETNDYGYFQINMVNHEDLSNKTQTANSPLNPYINMNWGTFMLADLYAYWSERGLSGNTLDEYVWSSYNKGLTGFKNNGYAYNYIYKMRESINYINSVF